MKLDLACSLLDTCQELLDGAELPKRVQTVMLFVLSDLKTRLDAPKWRPWKGGLGI